MSSQVISHSENIAMYWLKHAMPQSIKKLTLLVFMLPQIVNRPESFIAEIAGDDDSFKVVCFNVVFYGIAHAFFSTHFASVGFLVPIRQTILAFLHH